VGERLSLKVEHLNPFIAATVSTFAAMVHSEAKAGKVSLESGRGTRRDISGVIGLSGQARGSVALGFPRITALKVASAFVNMRLLALDDTVTDAIGELANIVAGSAKRDLGGFDIRISLPTVVLGDAHSLAGPRDIVPMSVPFLCPLGPFELAVRFRSEAET
jgi:chemotaxis protein CheX